MTKITAHSGAMATGLNSKKYFKVIGNYKIDGIEVDVRKRGEYLYIARTIKIFPKMTKLSLEFTFKFAKKNNIDVFCDIEERGIVKEIIALAKKEGVTNKLNLTGSIYPEDVVHITEGSFYAGLSFLGHIEPRIDNLKEIKVLIDSFNNPHIVGLHLPYRYASNQFVVVAKELGILTSFYNVDDEQLLERLLEAGVDNITTNKVDFALGLKDSKFL